MEIYRPEADRHGVLVSGGSGGACGAIGLKHMAAAKYHALSEKILDAKNYCLDHAQVGHPNLTVVNTPH